MTIDELLDVGVRQELGSHRFTADEIKRFAAKYDPQPFHVDEAMADQSLLGGLCASGWHTASVWMRLNLQARDALATQRVSNPKNINFGPSPGFQNLNWPAPVRVGDTITYFQTVTGHRRLASRPGWGIVFSKAEGLNQNGQHALRFEATVLFQYQ